MKFFPLKDNIKGFALVVLVMAIAAASPLKMFAGGGESPDPGKDKDAVMELRFYEGIREQAPAPAKVVTSYSLKPMGHGDKVSFTDGKVSDERLRLTRIFNVEEVRLLNRWRMTWLKKRSFPLFRGILINNHQFLVTVKLLEKGGVFLVKLSQREEKKSEVLLETKISLPELNETVFGFEDTLGGIYFLALERGKDVVGGDIGPEGLGRLKGLPPLIHRTVPKYPPGALARGLEGRVYVEITIDIHGRVVAATVIETTNRDFNLSALKAVRRWKYEPYREGGKVKPVTFLVTVEFTGKPAKGGK